MSTFFRHASKSLLKPSTASLRRSFAPRSLTTSASRSASSSSSTSPASSKTLFHTGKPSGHLNLLSHSQTQVTTLPNGLRVCSEHIPGVETATVGVYIDAGTRYEREENNGVAHFVEHMLFKGTKRRSKRDLELEIETLGGHLNAYTSREQTVYYANLHSKDVSKVSDLIADMVQNSKFDSADVEREKDTILREEEGIQQDMREVTFDHLHGTAYRNNALGRVILGTPQQIIQLTKQQMTDYVQSHYTANRMVFAAAGAVEHQQIVDLAGKLFSNLPASAPAGKEPFKQPAVFTGSDIIIRYDDMGLAHFAVAFPTAGWTDPDTIPLILIQSMLGSWEKSIHNAIHSSSKLISTVAKFELANSIETFHTQYSDTGLFGVYAVAEPTTLNNLSWAIMDAIASLCYNVEDNRLNEAKAAFKTAFLANLDQPAHVCEEVGRHLLTYGRRIHPVEMLARIDAVDAAAVKQAANRFFFDRDHALAAIGPVHELPDYNFFRSRSYFARF